MAKGQFWEDTFEQLAELGKSTVKKTTQAVNQTFSPLKILENMVSNNQSLSTESKEKLKKENNNHTPLDLQKLQERYRQQDEAKEKALRQRLFQLVKKGEEEVLTRKKQEEAEKERRKAYEEQEKKRKEEEKKRQEQEATIPKGKMRKSIFSPKKATQQKTVEIKPSIGKH